MDNAPNVPATDVTPPVDQLHVFLCLTAMMELHVEEADSDVAEDAEVALHRNVSDYPSGFWVE